MFTADLLCEKDFYLDGFYLGCFEFFVTVASHAQSTASCADHQVVIRDIKIQGERTPSVVDRQMALLAGQETADTAPPKIETALFDLPADWRMALTQQLLDDDHFLYEAEHRLSEAGAVFEDENSFAATHVGTFGQMVGLS